MMSADSGAAVLETNDGDPKVPDKKKTKFDVVIIVVQAHQDIQLEYIVPELVMIL